MTNDDEQLWRRRFRLFAMVRLVALGLFLLGVAVVFTDLAKPGGWPLLGGILAITGAISAVVAPRAVRRTWDE